MADPNTPVDVKNLKRVIALQSTYINDLEGKVKNANPNTNPNANPNGGTNPTTVGGNSGGADLGLYEAQLMLESLRNSNLNNSGSVANTNVTFPFDESADSSTGSAGILSNYLSPEPPQATHDDRQPPPPSHPPGNTRRNSNPNPTSRNRAQNQNLNQNRNRSRNANGGGRHRRADSDGIGPPPLPSSSSNGRVANANANANAHARGKSGRGNVRAKGYGGANGNGTGNGRRKKGGLGKDALLEKMEQQALLHESEMRELRDSKNTALEELHAHWKQVSDRRKAAHAQVSQSVGHTYSSTRVPRYHACRGWIPIWVRHWTLVNVFVFTPNLGCCGNGRIVGETSAVLIVYASREQNNRQAQAEAN